MNATKLNALMTALQPILDAVDVTDSDTISSLSPDETVIWVASGSWSPAKELTLGDLRRIYRAAKDCRA